MKFIYIIWPYIFDFGFSLFLLLNVYYNILNKQINSHSPTGIPFFFLSLVPVISIPIIFHYRNHNKPFEGFFESELKSEWIHESFANGIFKKIGWMRMGMSIQWEILDWMRMRMRMGKIFRALLISVFKRIWLVGIKKKRFTLSFITNNSY